MAVHRGDDGLGAAFNRVHAFLALQDDSAQVLAGIGVAVFTPPQQSKTGIG
jgi:hypothetical protein